MFNYSVNYGIAVQDELAQQNYVVYHCYTTPTLWTVLGKYRGSK